MGVKSPVEAEAPAAQAGVIQGLWHSHTGTNVRLILTIVSLLALVRTYLFTYRYFCGTVWLDFWFWVGDFQRWVEHRFTFHDLIKPLGEHRIVTTRPLLLLDSLAFDMNGRTLVIANLVVLLVLGFILAQLVRRHLSASEAWSWPPLFWAALISAVCQYENLLIPMDVGVALTCVTTCAAALLLAEATSASAVTSRAIALTIGAALMAVAATFSMANGVLATPALLLILPLRRARPAVWAIFVPFVLLGLAAFFHRYHGVHDLDLHLFEPRLIVLRILYVGNFLGSILVVFPKFAAPAGFIGLLLFLLAAWLLAKRYVFKREPLPGGDAALIAVGVFVAMGGPVGSLSTRIFLGGADAALTPRYATYSLLFAIVLLGLYARWVVRERLPDWIGRFAMPGVGLIILGVASLPYNDSSADDMHRALLVDADLLRNNVAVEWTVPWYLGAKIEDIRDSTIFLHARRLSMFSAAAGPPASILADLDGLSDVGGLPACEGYIDRVYAIDSTGFLLSGWAVDPAGQTSASWIAVLDGKGNLLGTSRALASRPDVQASLKMTKPAYGFVTGFRLATALQTAEESSVQLLGLFPGKSQPICRLPGSAVIGPIPIEPITQLSDPASISAEPTVDGFIPWDGAASGLAAPPWAVGQLWVFSPAKHRDGKATLRFQLSTMPEAGRALAVPFGIVEASPNHRIIFTMGDGARLETDLAMWSLSEWRAAILPSEQLAKHGGPVTVEVQAGGDTWLAVGAPLVVTLRPEWSRLF